jgi:hypothetical protein
MTSDEPSIDSLYADVLNDDPTLSHVVETLHREVQIAFAAPMPSQLAAEIERRVLHASALQPKQRSLLRDAFSAVHRRSRVAVLSVVVAIAVVAAGTFAYAASSGVIRVQNPERTATPHALTGVPQFTFAVRSYRSTEPASAAQESGLPVAYLSPVPANLVGGTVETAVIPPGKGSESGTGSKVDFRLRSAVRYRANGHTVVIELTQPSTTIVNRYHFWLGNHTIVLSSGERAWTQVLPEVTPYIVTFVSGQYLVGVASDLSVAQTEDIASHVIVSREAQNPARVRGTWPTPVPMDTPIAGIRVEVFGGASHYVDSHGRQVLGYQFAFRNFGTVGVNDLAVAMILPRGLAFAGKPPVQFKGNNDGREWTWPIGSGYGGFDDKTLLRVTDPAAFERGLAVRVSWTENGVPHQKTFHFPITKALRR